MILAFIKVIVKINQLQGIKKFERFPSLNFLFITVTHLSGAAFGFIPQFRYYICKTISLSTAEGNHFNGSRKIGFVGLRL